MLDESQKAVVYDKHKHTLVLAGAGSGKTFTIVEKIKYLLKQGYKENEILCISLTNETVNSLKHKLKIQGIFIDVYTFHKLGLLLLNNKDLCLIDNYYLNIIIREFLYTSRTSSLIKISKIIATKESILKSKSIHNLTNEIIRMIHIIKSNNISPSSIINLNKKYFGYKKEYIKLLTKIYLLYSSELKSQNKIDFDDMISKAIEQVKYSNISYKYIIIDEAQDTSKVRLDLILEILKYTNADLLMVGDDYQSIYSFTGCNINLFLNISKYIPDINIMKLKYTYRNSQELVNIATSFIMKNKKQLKKEIISNKHNNKPIKICFNISINKILDIVDDDYLILGRNNKDLQGIEGKSLTIHKSKGLEASDIIIVNSDNVINKNVNRNILINKENIIYEEERRIFYVAITRAKNNVYILVNKKISSFVKELIHDYPNNIEYLF